MPPPSPTRSITIGPYSFTIKQGYASQAEGFSIGPAELEALDALRAERIRKRGFKVLLKLRKGSAGPSGAAPRRTLSEGQLRLLGDEIAKFDRETRLEKTVSNIESASRRVSTYGVELDDPTDDPQGEFEHELRRLAEQRLDAEERTRGVVLPPDLREAAMQALLEEPLLREAARARVEAQATERERILADLF